MRNGDGGIHVLLICPYAFNSGMFQGIFEKNLLTKKLFPMMTTDAVAMRILSAMERKESIVFMPCILGIAAYAARLLPQSVYDFSVCLFGAQDGMDNFVGRRRGTLH